MKNKVVKLSKMYIETEAEALEKASKKLGVFPAQLRNKHTDTHFVFELIGTGVNNIEVDQSSDDVFNVLKEVEPDLREAKKEAAAHFNTFPGNIKTVTDNETCFQFKKVR